MDIKELITGGINITLSEITNVLLRIYQHGHLTRFETHISRKHGDPKTATLEDLMGLIYFGIEGGYGFAELLNKLKDMESKISEMNNKLLSLTEDIATNLLKSIRELFTEDLNRLRSLQKVWRL